MLFNTLVIGLIMGGIYALIAMGLSLQYGVARILNISHGEFIMIGACLTWSLSTAGVHPVLAVVICCPLTLLVGFLLHRFLYERMKRIAPAAAAFEGNAMLLAFGIMFILQNSATRVWGSEAMAYMFLARPVIIGESYFALNRLFVFALAIVVIILFYLFLTMTRLGKSIRASAQDSEAASLMGVNIKTVMALCFGIGAMLAGIAGSLLSMIEPARTTMGMGYSIIALIVVVLGGLGSIPGSLVGGLILGVVGTYVQTIEPSLMIAAFYAIIMIILLVRPQGLFRR